MLVPFRIDEPGSIRDESWQVVRPRLERLDWPIFCGDEPGAWRRAGAVNAAATAAGDWDVAIIADADTICEADAIRAAVGWVQRSKGAARPHDRLWRLTPLGSKAIAHRGPEALDLTRRAYTTGTFRGGGLLVVHRAAWDAVGGMDAGYVEWGYEDSAFNVALLTGPGWDVLRGSAYHLWHPRADLKDPATRANRARFATFERQHLATIRKAGIDKAWGKGKIL